MKTRCLISELCRQFYNLRWVSGTGVFKRREWNYMKHGHGHVIRV
ncbi:hypothetical protein V6Z11_D13G176100 [Gossypium hirsutum]